MNKVSISTGCLPRLENCRFYELSSVIRMMERFLKESKLDGFEFVLLPEWDCENPPLTPTTALSECEKHSIDELIETLEPRNYPLLSVHANRDIGSYLCSEKIDLINKGTRLIDECLTFTQRMGCKICVFHFWDTWKESFNIDFLIDVYRRFQTVYPQIDISIENIPTRHWEKSPFQIVKNFKHKTLDLKWASMFNEFSLFNEIMGEVDNIHVQGKHQDGSIIPTIGNLNYEMALQMIQAAGYTRAFTIELEGTAHYDEVLKYFEKLKNSAILSS